MRILALVPLVASLVSVQAQKAITFINPEDSSVSKSKNFALNPTYVIGSSINIQWTDSNNNISLVMYQERPKDDFEYIFQNSFDITSFRWTVGTQKDLKNGAVFFFQIFKKGETSPTASSRYFNLTRGRDDEVTTTSTSSSASITPTLSSSSTQTTTSQTPSNSAAPIEGGNTGGGGGGLSTGAKVGLGVGIPIAVFLGLGAGWFFFGRKRKNPSDDYTSTLPPNQESKYTPPGEGSYAPDASNEQAGGFYKPQGSPHPPPPSELYTPNANGAPVEMPSQRYA